MSTTRATIDVPDEPLAWADAPPPRARPTGPREPHGSKWDGLLNMLHNDADSWALLYEGDQWRAAEGGIRKATARFHPGTYSISIRSELKQVWVRFNSPNEPAYSSSPDEDDDPAED